MLLNNTSFKLKSGNKYHIKNGFATKLQDLWWLNSVFVGYHKENDSVELLEFIHNGIVFFIDSSLMHIYSANNSGKFYQFIPSGNK